MSRGYRLSREQYEIIDRIRPQYRMPQKNLSGRYLEKKESGGFLNPPHGKEGDQGDFYRPQHTGRGRPCPGNL